MVSKLAVEVPLHRLERGRVPALAVPAAGPPVFDFPPVPSAAGLVRVPDFSPISRRTLWVLDAGAPSELLLVEYGFAAEWEETAARVAFDAPLLPCIGTVVAPQATQAGARCGEQWPAHWLGLGAAAAASSPPGVGCRRTPCVPRRPGRARHLPLPFSARCRWRC